MNIKEFMQDVKATFIATANEMRVNPDTCYWTEGICLAILKVHIALRDKKGMALLSKELESEAYSLLKAYRPNTWDAYWWTNRKDEGSFEEAMTPRLAVLDSIINKL